MHILTRNRMYSWAEENGITPENGFPSKDEDLFEYYSAFVYMNEFLQGDLKHLSEITIHSQEFGLDSAGVFVNGKFVGDPDDLSETLNEGHFNRVHVIFIQAKTATGYDQSMIARFINQVKTIAEAATEIETTRFKGDLLKIARLINAVIENIGRFETPQIPCSLYYVTTSSHNGTQQSLKDPQVIDALKGLENLGIFQTIKPPEEAEERLGTEIIDFKADGHKELWIKYRMSTAPQEVQFKWDRRQTIPANSDLESASIGVVTAQELLKILSVDGELRSNIFDENVRLYQGHDNPVNQEIANTLNSDRRGQFPYLNNGVTLITGSMSTVSDLVTLVDYQVVNGGQTSHEVFHWASSLPEDEGPAALSTTWVPLKVIQSPDRSTLRDVTLATNNQTQVTDFEKRSNSPKSSEVEEYFSQSGPGGLRYKRQSGVSKMDTVQAKVTETAELTRSVAAAAFGQSSIATRSKKEVEAKFGDYIWDDGHPEGMYYYAAFLSYRIDAFFNRNRNNEFSRVSIARFHIAMLASVMLAPDLESIFRKQPGKVTSKELSKIAFFKDPAANKDLEKIVDEHIEKAATTVLKFYKSRVADGSSLLKDHVRGNTVQIDLLDFLLANR